MVIKAVKEFVFDKNAPMPQCHASSVLPMPDKKTVAAWVGDTGEESDDVNIWVSR